MERILVFDSGKIVEYGRHAKLFAHSRFYKTLWNSQVDRLLL